ncbi:MAG TPA: hypothetical protein GXX26_04180 [Clostridiaceae bacterium]|nr:hypothetical protein [Clostridiaceae bacterium]
MPYIKEYPWCSNQTLSINRQKNRASYIPYSAGEKYDFEGIRDTDRCILLNGEWDFQWFPSPMDVSRTHLEGKGLAHKIKVPMNWQFAGFGVFHYTDEMYPFPIDPPYVPMTNECGVYHRTVRIDPSQKEEWRYYLNFEGVESAFFVYVNGIEAGFNQGSRMHSEFEITSLLHEGVNDIVVQVMQYSAASYLEDQDEWWLGGIIRDVYLLKRPKVHIANVNIETNFCADDNTGSISVSIYTTGSMEAEAELIDGDGTPLFCESFRTENNKYVFKKELENVQGWNAEQPYLYRLIVRSLDDNRQINEVIPFQVGFRNLVIRNGILLWNGRRILMKGINRHEFNAFSGRAVTYEQTKSELMMIKKAGMNAVRTSHYPNNPFFYDLCDRLGLYVIDEADLETHGFEVVGEPTALCDDIGWEKAYLDRISRMVERDRNHVCIVLWSLGNESSYGRNFKAMYDWVKANEPIRPVHYEGDSKNQSVDVSSTMYSTIGKLAELDTIDDPPMPHILCEFGHAMGNGPGSLNEYFDLIEKSNRIQGCFLWEFKDHGISRDIDNREEAYLYGGDFKEKYHNGNFCMDGLVRSNGEPSPAFYEYQKVIEDIHVIGFDRKNKTVIVRNRMDFSDTEGVICHVEIYKYHILTEERSFGIPAIKAHETGRIQLDDVLSDYDSDKEYITIKLRFEKEVRLLDETVTRIMGTFSSPVSEEKTMPMSAEAFINGRPGENLSEPSLHGNPEKAQKIHLNETARYYEIKAGSVSLTIDKSNGAVYDYRINGRLVIEQGPVLNLFRAYTDNDKKMVQLWTDMHLNSCSMIVYSTGYSMTENDVRISFEGRYAPNGMKWGIQTSITYIVDIRGAVEMNISGEFKNAPDVHLPKIGTQLMLSEEYNEVVYCGMGPVENYCDRDKFVSPGIYKAKADEMDQPYDYPQEYGNRTRVEWASFYSKKERTGIIFSTSIPVDFSVRPYSDQQLYEAKHSFELIKENKLFVNLDYKNSGLGSGSCGPERLEQYRVLPLPFEYSIYIRPYMK